MRLAGGEDLLGIVGFLLCVLAIGGITGAGTAGGGVVPILVGERGFFTGLLEHKETFIDPLADMRDTDVTQLILLPL